MNELTELARRLVSIDSVNPDLVPDGAGAHGAAEWVELDDLEVLRRDLLSTAEEFCA